jgi:hypothetical protein
VTLLSELVGAPAHWYSVSLDTLCSNSAVSNDSVNGCPYDGTATIGGRPFSFEAFVDNNDDSVSPAYWDLINFPSGSCRSVTVNFGIPDNGGAAGGAASLKIVQGSQSTAAQAHHGSTTTFQASLDDKPWVLWNSATSSSDEIAIRLTATCTTSSGF